MATINCPECTKEVSESAKDCPHCGFVLNKPKRSIIGKIALWLFILFNVLMAYSLFAGISNVATDPDLQNLKGAEATGAAIGAGLGGMMILVIWVFGDIILGLFALLTRPK